MENISQNNKRIAKNTLLLYIRMFITLVISLYTSRIVLQKLGVVDFGINNVIAGMVSMFTFLNGTLASGTQRFITFALGENDFEKEQSTFSTTFIIHLSLALIIGIGIFIGGLYFLDGKLTIPASRMDAAYWVFYCCVITVVLNITQVPYMSSIIAHEDMSIYAYMSIFDAFAKLGVAFALVFTSSIDHLKLYALLLAVVQMIDMIGYRFFCIYKYRECHVKAIFDKKLFKQIFVFSGWNILGCSAVLFNNQGFNMLLNVFYGPVMNAARGISNQVNNVASQFVGSFQTAVDPEIVKNYASNQIDKMNRLIYNNARFAGLLILYIIVPLMVELPFVLHLWLGKYPDQTVFFTRVILVQTLITSMGRSVVMGLHATGKMKMTNILAGGNLLMILPISYLLLKIHVSLNMIMIINLIPWLIETFIELVLMRNYVGLSLSMFYKFSYAVVFGIGLLLVFPLILICHFFSEGWLRLLINCMVSASWGGLLIYRYGLNDNMRKIIKAKLSSVLSHKK
jgi:O-antigen/teichoic acid export membrane protein